jgi:hypothetical protein
VKINLALHRKQLSLQPLAILHEVNQQPTAILHELNQQPIAILHQVNQQPLAILHLSLLQPKYKFNKTASSAVEVSSRAEPRATHILRKTQVMDPTPSYLTRTIKTDSEHISKFEYLVKMFYNEVCDHFETDKYIYYLWQPAFPIGIPKMKDNFGTVFHRIDIFKCFILKDYEPESVSTCIKIIEDDNITLDNFINGSSAIWLCSIIGCHNHQC